MSHTTRPHWSHGRWVLSLALVVPISLAGCGEGGSDPLGPDDEPGPTVLVLRDGGGEVHVTEILEDDGITVVHGGAYDTFTGVGLDSVDAVVVLASVAYNRPMQPKGEASLVGFVAQGGGLVTLQPVASVVEPLELYRVLSTVLPVTGPTPGGVDGPETYTSSTGHPVSEGLPASFVTPEDQVFVEVDAKTGALVVLTGANYGPGVVTWGAPGPVVFWNGTGDFARLRLDPAHVTFNEDLDRMLVNAVRYAADNEREYGPIEVDRVQFVQRYLTVMEDGDSGTNPGDFYVTARITNLTNGHQSELAGYFDRLQTANPGVQALGDTLEVTLPKVDGFGFAARLSFYEGDGTGTEPRSGNVYSYAYDAAAGCWARQFETGCVDAATTDNGDLTLVGVSGSPVDVDLRWQVRVE